MGYNSELTENHASFCLLICHMTASLLHHIVGPKTSTSVTHSKNRTQNLLPYFVHHLELCHKQGFRYLAWLIGVGV